MSGNDDSFGFADTSGTGFGGDTTVPAPPGARFEAELTPKLVELEQVPTDEDTVIEGGPNASDVDVSFEQNYEELVVREFAPDVVTELGGTLPWDTESAQLQGGETVTSNGDDMSFQLKFRCVCDSPELRKLLRMRSSPDKIRLVSVLYKGPVTFDQLKVERLPDANGAVEADGTENPYPRYDVQLQSREESQAGE